MLALTPKVDFIPTEFENHILGGTVFSFICHMKSVASCEPLPACLGVCKLLEADQGKANGGGTVWISILFKEGGERRKEENDDQQ